MCHLKLFLSFHFRSIMAYNQAGEMRVNYYSSPTAYNKNIATGTLRCKKHELKYNDSPQQGEQRKATD